MFFLLQTSPLTGQMLQLTAAEKWASFSFGAEEAIAELAVRAEITKAFLKDTEIRRLYQAPTREWQGQTLSQFVPLRHFQNVPWNIWRERKKRTKISPIFGPVDSWAIVKI